MAKKKFTIFCFLLLFISLSRSETLEEELDGSIGSNKDPCRAIIVKANEMLDRYNTKDDKFIPHKLFAHPLELTSSDYCDYVIRILTTVDRSRVCENSEKNKKVVERFRDRGDQKKKQFCDRAYFLNILNRCRPKAMDIELNIGKEITKFRVSNEQSFIKICW